MKRYLWVLLLAACSAPTGEVTKTVKTNVSETKNVLQTENTVTESSETEVKTTDKSEIKVKEVKKETLEGTYFGFRKLKSNEINMEDIEDDDDMPNDRRLALEFDKEGNVGWGDADDENTAKTTAKQKGYTYEVDGNTVTVKKGGHKILVLELRDNNRFIYITEDKTNKISSLKANVTYKNTGLALNGIEVESGYGSGDLENRVKPPIPKYNK